MKKVTSVFLCCFLFIALNYAQSGQVMTLKECIEMGIANNLSLQNKNLNVQKANTGSLKTGSNCYRSSMLSPILPIVPNRPFR